MTDKVQSAKIIISADVSELKKGVNEAKKDVQALADTAEKSGKRIQKDGREAADALKEIGKGAKEAAEDTGKAGQEISRVTRGLERSLERLAAAERSGGKNTLAYHLELAKQRGADVAYLEQRAKALGLAEKASEKLEKATARAAISQKQFNQAVRQVPMQMTDIVTQLAGGQNPMLVAIQQGGQLRDVFGGFGNMMRGIVQSIGPAKLAIGGLAGVFGAVGYAAFLGSKEMGEYRKALILSGNQAGATADMMYAAAARAGDATGEYAAAREAVTALAQTGKVAAADFARFTETMVRQSQATGVSVQDLAKQYADIANDPLAAVVKLSGAYRTMTADVYKQAAALIDQGREQEAVMLVQRQYDQESADMAKRVTDNLGWIESGWIGIKNAAAAAWDTIKDIGRENTYAQELADIERQLKLGMEGHGNHVREMSRERRQQLEKRRDVLRGIVEGEKVSAALTAKYAKENEAGVNAADWASKAQSRYRNKQERQAADLAENERNRKARLAVARTEEERARINAEHNKLAARINEQYREQAKKTPQSKIDRSVFPTTSAGLRLKPGATAGGSSQAGTFAAAHALQKLFGNRLFRFGAFNDAYHKGKNSKHNQGLAFDATPNHNLSREKKIAAVQEAKEYFRSLGFADGKDFQMVFEPGGKKNKNGTVSTADHWHFQWMNKEAAARFAASGSQAKLMASGGLFRAAGGKQEQPPFEKWQTDFADKVHDAQVRLQLASENVGKSFQYQLSLLTSPEWEKFDETQRNTALAMAKQADERETAAQATAKHTEVLRNMTLSGDAEYRKRLEEIGLIGKTRKEIERLTIVRKYERAINQAKSDGAGQGVIQALIEQRETELKQLAHIQQEREKKDNDWLGGIRQGMQKFAGSMGSLNKEVEGFVDRSFNAMGDALTEFVTTGKADFRSLAKAILADLSKVLIKMALVKAMQTALGYADGGAAGGASASGGAASGSPDALFSDGGYTGAGGKYEPAGIVHKGEVVFSQKDVARHGGVAAVERLRLKGYAEGGIVGGAMPSAARAGGGSMQVNITINRDGKTQADADSEGDTETAKALAKALPLMIERWYIQNVARPGAPFYRKG